jgi:hypothetical protein
VKKEELKKSLNRMGIPTYPGGKVLKQEMLSLPFKKSGMEVTKISPIKTEKHREYCMYRVHLAVTGGDVDKIDAVVAKNLEAVENKLTHFCKTHTNGVLDTVKVNMHSRNNTNCWLDLLFYYNIEAILCHEFGPFCYHLMERG